MLCKGYVINSMSVVDKLIKLGALKQDTDESYYNGIISASNAPTESLSAFDRMDDLLLNLKNTLITSIKAPDSIDLQARILSFALNIQSSCQEDVDATLASPYMDIRNPYIVVHQAMGAILTEIIAARKGLTADERLPYICAALTRDIGQLQMQSNLDKHDGPLPPLLKLNMQQHPSRGVEMLRYAGIDDADWLNAVQMHHERLDGSGYVLGLQNEDINRGARMLAIADIYSAMIKSRPYRTRPYHPQSALRKIYLDNSSSIDGELIQMLIKGIGMLPPASTVRLKNNEIAVVKSCTINAAEATVFSIFDRHGMPMYEPMRRETRMPDFEIVGTVPFDECKSASILIKRLWVK